LEATLRIHTERTPNPDSVKWVVGRVILEGPRPLEFGPGTGSEESPLAARLVEISGVSRVLLGQDQLTVSKSPEADWRALGQTISQAIRDWAASGLPALGPAYEAPVRAPDDEVEARIREILESEVSPYVEQDGGEISLVSFRDGVVEVALRGACVGCPSSTVTLKLGVEARLREEIPEVDAVVAV
jgi:Fe-S cluster biogenesis protein NfuA